jgi:DNA (cytosine-5)-methyltransferase 1
MAELCAGFGGLTMAALLAGWDVELAWYAETDRDARRVMEAHHPGTPNVGDITTAQFSAQEPVDVLAAGWPCQPASSAGQRRGSGDDRWLWPDVARAVRVLRPAVFVGENVPGLLTIEGGRLFGGVLADLDGLGYTVRWTTVGACRVGLCHHRHRVFIVATRGGGAVEPAGWPVARRTGSGWETAADTLFGAGSAPHWPAAATVHGGRVWAEPCSPCGDSGVTLLPTPDATHGRKTTRTGPLLPGVVQMLPTPNATDSEDGPRAVPPVRTHGGPDHGPRLRDVAAALLPTPRASDSMSGGPNQRSNHGALALKSAVQPGRFGPYEAAVRRHELVTGRRAPEPTEPNSRGGVRLAADFTEWMLALPAGWVTDHVGRNPALARLGNGIAVPAAAYALSLLLPSGPVRPELAGVGR